MDEHKACRSNAVTEEPPPPHPPASLDSWFEATVYGFMFDVIATKREFPNFQCLLCMRKMCTYQHPLSLMEEDVRWVWTWSLNGQTLSQPDEGGDKLGVH